MKLFHAFYCISLSSTPIESITYAQLHLPNVLECVPEERMFNVDESGLLYKQKPKYRLSTKALKGKVWQEG